jgi:hypothetical protein
MKVENRAYASPIYMLFVSQGSRAQCFNERPGPHSNGLKPSAPPHCVASSVSLVTNFHMGVLTVPTQVDFEFQLVT